MIKKEISYLKLTDHPNIIKCIEVIEDNHKLYILTDSL